MIRTTVRRAATGTPSGNARPLQQPAPTGPDLRRRLRRAVERHGPVLAVYGTLKLIGFAAFMWLLHSAGDYRTKHPRFGGGAHPWDVLASWDGWWYQQIATHGYDPRLVPVPGATGPITLEGNSAAFFPLYPALMRLVSELNGLGPYGAGLLVSVVASLAAALGIYAVTERLGGRQAGLAAAGLWAVWPGSGVEWAVYSDSLYVALAVWACHAVLSRRWLTAGLLTCVAGLNRPTAVALIAAVAVAALLRSAVTGTASCVRWPRWPSPRSVFSPISAGWVTAWATTAATSGFSPVPGPTSGTTAGTPSTSSLPCRWAASTISPPGPSRT